VHHHPRPLWGAQIPRLRVNQVQRTDACGSACSLSFYWLTYDFLAWPLEPLRRHRRSATLKIVRPSGAQPLNEAVLSEFHNPRIHCTKKAVIRNMQIPASYRTSCGMVWQRQLVHLEVILEHVPDACRCVESGDGYQRSPFDDETADAIWRGRFEMFSPFTPQQKRPPSGQGCPLFCCLAGCSSPHTWAPPKI
jgi:hypothetical protein